MKLLVTGGAGFIGSNFIRMILRAHDDIDLVNFDALTYAGNLENLSDLAGDSRYRFIQGDITDREVVEQALAGVEAVVHFAAESHVDRSILGPEQFVRTNVLGTQVLLEEARKKGIGKFIHVSTDEVYGSLGETGLFTEQTPLAPNSPYSASKAGSDLLARAYCETYGLPVVITRCSNNYGPYQFPEKLIPLMITRTLADEKLPVYGDGLNIRDWLHVEDHCRAIDLVLRQGKAGEVYNIGGNNERTNLEIVRTILEELGKPETLISFVEDRLGHDRRYGIDGTKISTELGWKPSYTFETGIRQTIRWYLDNRQWWMRILNSEYRK